MTLFSEPLYTILIEFDQTEHRMRKIKSFYDEDDNHLFIGNDRGKWQDEMNL